MSEVRLTDRQVVAGVLRARADELDNEAAQMRGKSQIEWRTPLGTLRNRDQLGFLAAEYRLLAIRLDTL